MSQVDKYSFFTKCRLDLQRRATTKKVWGQMMDGRKNEFKLIEEYELGISSDSVLPEVAGAYISRCVERCRLSDFEGAIADCNRVLHIPGASKDAIASALLHRGVLTLEKASDRAFDDLYRVVAMRGASAELRDFASEAIVRNETREPEDSYAHTHTIDVATAAPPVGEQNTELSRFTAQTLISEMQLPLPRTSDMQRLTTTVSSLDEVIRLHQRTWRPEKLREAKLGRSGALLLIGDISRDFVCLTKAIGEYRSIINQYKDADPVRVLANAHINLASGLWLLGELRKDAACLREAIDLYQYVLQDDFCKRHPHYWAKVNNNLGNTLWALLAVTGNVTCYESAYGAFENALLIFLAAKSEYYTQVVVANMVGLEEHILDDRLTENA